MKTSDADILIVPGWLNSGPDHWQSRWERNLTTARRIDQDDWHAPDRDAWVANIVAAVSEASRPVVLVAHSLGVIAIAHAAPKLVSGSVVGAFLVAPADVDNTQCLADEPGQRVAGRQFRLCTGTHAQAGLPLAAAGSGR